MIQCFVALRGANDVTTPLSVYCDKNGPVHLLNACDIELHMRLLAAEIHKLCPKKSKKELQRWSSHSTRVGACVMLHQMGATEAQLKFLL